MLNAMFTEQNTNTLRVIATSFVGEEIADIRLPQSETTDYLRCLLRRDFGLSEFQLVHRTRRLHGVMRLAPLELDPDGILRLLVIREAADHTLLEVVVACPAGDVVARFKLPQSVLVKGLRRILSASCLMHRACQLDDATRLEDLELDPDGILRLQLICGEHAGGQLGPQNDWPNRDPEKSIPGPSPPDLGYFRPDLLIW
eukprot:CAMPEP_0115577644 /NCGR_PEP_ID=MMETSP0272-20121206/3178_1 /TAXON_ID=71861 /ORGANISM="Scrippsiella trochoidea, Strain CCMP3099" /LENGTH=199 /DNA_ID=CAMNT_0003012461 /DNA_START=40 /DNA_END=636 /DNA_ORIENTATION=+